MGQDRFEMEQRERDRLKILHEVRNGSLTQTAAAVQLNLSVRQVEMIDDATNRLFGRFVERDTAAENMRVLRGYLKQYGRPLEFYTDKAGMFEVAVKRGENGDAEAMPPTQITRALTELGIGRISANSHRPRGGLNAALGPYRTGW